MVLFPPLQAPVWKTVEAGKGSGVAAGGCYWVTWNLGRNPHHGAPRAPGPQEVGLRATSGRREMLQSPVGQLQRSNCHGISSHEPHETVPGRGRENVLGERERERLQKCGCGKRLADEVPPREGGSTVALDLLETSLKELLQSGHQEKRAHWLYG